MAGACARWDETPSSESRLARPPWPSLLAAHRRPRQARAVRAIEYVEAIAGRSARYGGTRALPYRTWRDGMGGERQTLSNVAWMKSPAGDCVPAPGMFQCRRAVQKKGLVAERQSGPRTLAVQRRTVLQEVSREDSPTSAPIAPGSAAIGEAPRRVA